MSNSNAALQPVNQVENNYQSQRPNQPQTPYPVQAVYPAQPQHAVRQNYPAQSPQAVAQPAPNSLAILKQEAEILAASLDMEVKKVMALIMFGREVGVSATYAINNIFLEKGQVVISPDLYCGKLRVHPGISDFSTRDNGTKADVSLGRMTQSFSVSVTMADFEKLGLQDHPDVVANPALARLQLAMVRCGRIVFPDVFSGIRTSFELPQTRGGLLRASKRVVSTSWQALKRIRLPRLTFQPVAPAAPSVMDVSAQAVQPTQPALSVQPTHSGPTNSVRMGCTDRANYSPFNKGE